MLAQVESKDITLGSIPFIVLQAEWVTIVITLPKTITALLDQKVEIR